jgi:hypothetical protein
MKAPNHLRANFISDFLFFADDAARAQFSPSNPE